MATSIVSKLNRSREDTILQRATCKRWDGNAIVLGFVVVVVQD